MNESAIPSLAQRAFDALSDADDAVSVLIDSDSLNWRLSSNGRPRQVDKPKPRVAATGIIGYLYYREANRVPKFTKRKPGDPRIAVAQSKLEMASTHVKSLIDELGKAPSEETLVTSSLERLRASRIDRLPDRFATMSSDNTLGSDDLGVIARQISDAASVCRLLKGTH
jgi:hypothetical protein